MLAPNTYEDEATSCLGSASGASQAARNQTCLAPRSNSPSTTRTCSSARSMSCRSVSASDAGSGCDAVGADEVARHLVLDAVDARIGHRRAEESQLTATSGAVTSGHVEDGAVVLDDQP